MKLLYKTVLVGVLLVSFYSCSKKVEARKPITNTTSSTIQESIEINKKLYAAEEEAIETIIKDLDQEFQRGSTGFYYMFTKKDSVSGIQPKFGDRVTFEYDVTSLNGEVIYNKEDLSPITKSLEQEYGVFRGMREALKLMQTDEEMIVYFPSYAAYGYYGDQNLIGPNTPFKSRVRLLGINVEN
ncbi:gliding motility-associated peptidyl-prolyl isomerase GldI [Nonlabens sp.]